MKKYVKSILVTTAFGVIGVNAQVDCIALSQSVMLEVSKDKSSALEIVSKQIAAAPTCACEVIKSAIKASEGDTKQVAAIVEVAITAAPDQMRLITQCAIATAPDAIADIQLVLAKLDPNSGDSATVSKSSKAPIKGTSEEVKDKEWNPLDFPSDRNSTVGPRPGTYGGPQIISPGPQIESPPSSEVQFVTQP